MAQINAIQPLDDSGVTSLAIWNNCIIASYANGLIRFFDPENGKKKENKDFNHLKIKTFFFVDGK